MPEYTMYLIVHKELFPDPNSLGFKVILAWGSTIPEVGDRFVHEDEAFYIQKVNDEFGEPITRRS